MKASSQNNEEEINVADKSSSDSNGDFSFTDIEFFRNLPLPVVISFLNGDLAYINDEFSKAFGYTYNDILTAEKWWQVAYPDEKYRNEMKLEWNEKSKKSKGKDIKIETEVTCKDGSKKFVRIVWNVINGRHVVFMTDLTQDKRLAREILDKNEELKIARKRAEESDLLKSAFLANMSHEIRTPMNSIIGFSSLLSDKELPEDKRLLYISFIQNAGDHLLRIIDDIIDVSKIESNQLKLHKSRVLLAPMLKNIHSYHKKSKLFVFKTNVKFNVNISKIDKHLNIYTDEIRLKQVIDNLITNALKNTVKGSVEFGIHEMLPDGKSITFYVKDTGVGIPEKYQKMIFNRFLQIENHSTRQGTGLGLSIINGILTLLDGSIWFESKENEGTCFYFTIPV